MAEVNGDEPPLAEEVRSNPSLTLFRHAKLAHELVDGGDGIIGQAVSIELGLNAEHDVCVGQWALSRRVCEVAREVVESRPCPADEVGEEVLAHLDGGCRGSAAVVVEQDVGDVVPVLAGAPSVCCVGLGEEVAGESGDPQVDRRRLGPIDYGDLAGLPVARREAGASQVDRLRIGCDMKDLPKMLCGLRRPSADGEKIGVDASRRCASDAIDDRAGRGRDATRKCAHFDSVSPFYLARLQGVAEVCAIRDRCGVDVQLDHGKARQVRRYQRRCGGARGRPCRAEPAECGCEFLDERVDGIAPDAVQQ